MSSHGNPNQANPAATCQGQKKMCMVVGSMRFDIFDIIWRMRREEGRGLMTLYDLNCNSLLSSAISMFANCVVYYLGIDDE